MKRTMRAGLAAMLAIALLAGCGGKKQEPIPEPAPVELPPPPPPPPAPEPEPEPPKTLMQGDLQDVFYNFDSSSLEMDARNFLTANGGKLLEATDSRVSIEGHCDERGTVEYNLALGERRANAVKEFLVLQGVSPGLIEVISYGEERAAAYGSNDDAWGLNRRVELK